MRDAIEVGDLRRYREFLDFGKTRGNPDRSLAIRVGNSIFRQVGVIEQEKGKPGYMDELRGIVEKDHSEVLLSPEPFINEVNGAVALALHWISGADETKAGHLILVQAWPLSRTLGFTGRHTELMGPRKWRAASPKVIADALRRAYEDPITTEW